jgi:hypothetical protein
MAAADDWVTAPTAAAPVAAADDGIPTITVRPQGAKPLNAGNEGGKSSSSTEASQPHVSQDDWITRGSGAAPSGFSVTPPPPDKAPIVEAAAKQYGVPLPVAHFVGSTESHWNDAATGIPTSSGRASGAWQFMPETAKQYGLANPNDFPAATTAAMHKLSDLAAANGGDWEKAVQQYGTFSTGKGAAADAAVRQKFRDYMGNPTPVDQGQAQDIAQGTGRGLIQGAGYVLGMPADLWHMMDRGYQYALTEGASKLGIISPEDAEELRKPTAGVDETEPSTFGSENVNKHLMRLAQMAGADTSPPTTRMGRAAENVSSFLPGAAAFGAGSAGQVPGALVRYGLIPGATSEAAGQLTEGTAAEPYARVAGAMLPQTVGAGFSAAENALNPVNRSMQGLTQPQSSAAQMLLDQSRSAGAPLTVPEAVQQTTGSGTRLGDLQRVVEQSPQGAATMRPFFAQRPSQTETLATNTLDQIAGVPADPYEVAPRVQSAANQTMQSADTARTQAVNPYYKAAATDAVPTDEMEAFLQKLDKMISADKTGLTSAPLVDMRNALTEREAIPATATTPAQPRVPITDIENLDNARKYFRDLPAQPAYIQKALPKFVGSRVTSLAKELRSMMAANSPQFAAGKQLYQNITESTFNPLERSPIGQLAGAEKFPDQAKILFATNPLPGSEKAVGKAVRQIAQQDPEAAAQLVRMHLEQVFNEATQDNLPGANQFGGPKFVAVVAGNTQQAKNLEAAVRALPNGDVRWNALRKSMDIMQGMGTRQPVGSQTEFNRQINEALRNGSILPEIATTIASPSRWLHVVHDVYQHIVYGHNTASLARIFTEGSVDDLRSLARSGSRSVAGQSRLIGAIANVAGQQAAQQPQ